MVLAPIKTLVGLAEGDKVVMMNMACEVPGEISYVYRKFDAIEVEYRAGASDEQVLRARFEYTAAIGIDCYSAETCYGRLLLARETAS